MLLGVGKLLSIGLVMIVVSGCVSGQGSAQAPPSTSAPAATVSADKGSITGRVLNEELQAIAGADVALSGLAEAAAVTDAEGKFTFNDLNPGEYTVLAQSRPPSPTRRAGSPSTSSRPERTP